MKAKSINPSLSRPRSIELRVSFYHGNREVEKKGGDPGPEGTRRGANQYLVIFILLLIELGIHLPDILCISF